MGHGNSLCFQRIQPDIFNIDRIFVRRCETEKSVTVADETVSDPDIQTGLGRVRPFTAFWTDSLHCTTISHCVRRESATSDIGQMPMTGNLIRESGHLGIACNLHATNPFRPLTPTITGKSSALKRSGDIFYFSALVVLLAAWAFIRIPYLNKPTVIPVTAISESHMNI